MTETDPDDPVMVTYRLTCHTPECVNDGIPIVLTMPEGCAAMCGPCGQPITDVVAEEPAPEPKTEE